MTASPGRPIAGRLGFRFALVLAVALLPLGVVSLVQTSTLQGEVQRRTEAALLGQTLSAAADEVGVIRHAQGIMATLAQAVPPMIEDAAGCSALMRRTAAQEPTATLVAFVPVSGLMTCSSTGKSYDFSRSPLFAGIRDAKKPSFVVNRNGPISRTSILGISHPVFDGWGNYVGFVTLSLPHHALTAMEKDMNRIDPGMGSALVFWTFDRDGEILTSNMELNNVHVRVPRNRSLTDFVGKEGTVFQDVSQSGLQRTYAVVPLVAGELYLMSSWNAGDETFLQKSGIAPYLPPIIMWAVGLIVAAWAAEYLVTRHIRVLSRSIASFARGDRRLEELDLSTAPNELQDVGDAYLRMTESITLGEAQLEDSVHQKEVLLREVHHRVKNNLQLITSIMNMQMRKAIAPEAKVLLKGLQDRVMSLATIHRGLYQTSGLADVRADELFSDIARQLVNMASGPDKRFDVVLDVDDVHMTPDQAVPLSLLLTEAMTNAMKYGGADDRRPARIAVRLKRVGGSGAVLEVVNSMVAVADRPIHDPETSTGLGAQLLTAFAQQIGGTLEQISTATEYRLCVAFKVAALVDGEDRRDSDVADGNGKASEGVTSLQGMTEG
jgi:two-component system, sensor histidine kinase PdtaS